MEELEKARLECPKAYQALLNEYMNQSNEDLSKQSFRGHDERNVDILLSQIKK